MWEGVSGDPALGSPSQLIMSVIYNAWGIPRHTSHLAAVRYLEEIKKNNGSNPWPVIECCIKIWQDSSPKEWKAYIVEINDLRNTRKDPKFASTYDRVQGGSLRYILDIPEKVIKMIRCVYDVDELPMNKKFFHEFARRFPKFQIAQKL